MRTRYQNIEAFTTKDGSIIRELMHPDTHGNTNQSLAEATISPGMETRMHKHHVSEEIYYITSGVGIMTLADRKFEVVAGDSICIKPGTTHCIKNTGDTDLTILCCCSPPYSNDDTELSS